MLMVKEKHNKKGKDSAAAIAGLGEQAKSGPREDTKEEAVPKAKSKSPKRGGGKKR